MIVNRLLIFDLKGSLAHFRKFYTSSSSLSYSFPPRTTLIGIIAAILGRERDSYYEEFNSDNCKIALSIRRPIRKIMQTVNYIRTKEEDGFTDVRKVIGKFIGKQIIKYPTPLELVLASRITDEVVYRIYFFHKEDAITDSLYVALKKGRTEYPIYFGLSEFLANVELIADIPSQGIQERKTEDAVEIISVCNSEHIVEFEFENINANEPLQYVEEKMPLEFAEGRKIKRTANFVHEKNQQAIKGRMNISYIKVTYTEKGQTLNEDVTFME